MNLQNGHMKEHLHGIQWG